MRPDDPEDEHPTQSTAAVSPPAVFTAAVTAAAGHAPEDAAHLSTSSLDTESVMDEEELILLQQERGELGAGVDESADLTQMLLLQGRRAAAAAAAATAAGGSSGDSAAAACPVTPAVMSASPNEASQSVGINTVSAITAAVSEAATAPPPSRTPHLDSSSDLPSPSISSSPAARGPHASTPTQDPDVPSLLQLQLLEIANSVTKTPTPKPTTQVNASQGLSVSDDVAPDTTNRTELVNSIASDLVDAAFKEAVVSMVATADGREGGPVADMTEAVAAASDAVAADTALTPVPTFEHPAPPSVAASNVVTLPAQHPEPSGPSQPSPSLLKEDGESESLDYDDLDLGSSVISIGGDSDGEEQAGSESAVAAPPPQRVSLPSLLPEPASESRESSYDDEGFDEEDSSFPDALLLLDSEGGGGEGEAGEGEASEDLGWGMDQLISPVLDQAIMAAQAVPAGGEREGAVPELLREESSSSTGGPRRSSVPGVVCTHEASRAYVEEVMTRFLGEPPEVRSPQCDQKKLACILCSECALLWQGSFEFSPSSSDSHCTI